MTPEYYAKILAIMADDEEMMWYEMKQVMIHLKFEVEFEDDIE